MDFIPKSKRRKGNMDIFELLYGDHSKSHNVIQRKWRKTFLVTFFVSKLFRAYEKVKRLGAMRDGGTYEGLEQMRLEETQKQRHFCVLYPDSMFRQVWNIVIIVAMIQVAIVAPFQTSFVDTETTGWQILDTVNNVIFGIDLVLSFFFAYYNSNNKLVDQPAKIIRNYLSGWFFIDFAAIFPINLVLQSGGQSQGGSGTTYNKLLRLLRLPRLYRLLRLLKLGKDSSDIKKQIFLLRVLNILGINEGFTKVLVLLVNIVFLNHLVACGWHFIAKFSDFDENTWVARSDLVGTDAMLRYSASFYWSFQTLTTVGYGDINPFTTAEMIYSIAWMFFGVGFFSYTLGNLTSIMSSIDKKTVEYNRKVNQFNDFAMKVKLPLEIRNKINNFFQGNFYKLMYQSLDPSGLIQELPSQVQKDFLLFCFEFLRSEISLFDIDQNFTAAIVMYLYYFEVEHGDVMYREGDHAEEVYFLSSGKINLVNESGRVMVTMLEGCIFGEIEVLEDTKRKFFAVAEQDCRVYYCKKDTFLGLINEFPLVKQKLAEQVKRRQEKYKICQYLMLQDDNEGKFIDVAQRHVLKRSTDHYLNMLISCKERALSKKKNGLKFFQSTVEQDEEEKRLDEENQKEIEEMRKNLTSGIENQGALHMHQRDRDEDGAQHKKKGKAGGEGKQQDGKQGSGSDDSNSDDDDDDDDEDEDEDDDNSGSGSGSGKGKKGNAGEAQNDTKRDIKDEEMPSNNNLTQSINQRQREKRRNIL